MAIIVIKRQTAEDTQLEFTICDDCGAWDRGVDFHFPKCPRWAEAEKRRTEKIMAERAARQAELKRTRT